MLGLTALAQRIQRRLATTLVARPLGLHQAKEGGFEVSDETTHRDAPSRRSSSAEAAATRWRQTHPDDDLDHPPPSVVPEDDGVVPNRHSASAEAAALRWHERHGEEDF
jgi:hypothetical protein